MDRSRAAPRPRADEARALRFDRTDFYYSHKYEAAFGLRSMRLLVITSGRGRQPRSLIEEAERLNITPVRVTTWEQAQEPLSAEILFAPIWTRPFDPEPRPIYAASIPQQEER